MLPRPREQQGFSDLVTRLQPLIRWIGLWPMGNHWKPWFASSKVRVSYRVSLTYCKPIAGLIHGIFWSWKNFVSRNTQAAPVSCRGAGEFVFITSHGHGIRGTVKTTVAIPQTCGKLTNICSLPATEVTQAIPRVSSENKDSRVQNISKFCLIS